MDEAATLLITPKAPGQSWGPLLDLGLLLDNQVVTLARSSS